MKSMTSTDFFTEEERFRIEEAVRKAEGRTSGEIVPMIVEASYDYPRAEIIGGFFFSLAASVTLSWAFAGSSLWVFLAIFALLYFPFKLLVRTIPSLKRRFIHPDEIDAEVEEKAIVSFLGSGLHLTRDATGILILISLFERRVHVLADRGINDVVPPRTWDEIVEIVTEGIRQERACDALVAAVERCATLLEGHFPRKPDDRNELPDLIIG